MLGFRHREALFCWWRGSAGSVQFVGMNPLQNHAFTQLLAAWRRREDARHTGDVRDLAVARHELDRRRVEMRDSFGTFR